MKNNFLLIIISFLLCSILQFFNLFSGWSYLVGYVFGIIVGLRQRS